MDSKDNSKSNALFTEPWNGSRTPGFLKFKRDFAAGMGASFLHEDDYSLWQAATDIDQGGLANGADAMPAQGQSGHANATRRRRRRQMKTYERIYAHIDDERLREMLSSLVEDDRRGVNAWNLILRECDQGTSDLHILDIKKEFESCSIEQNVGYGDESITSFSRLLNSINTRLPIAHRYSEDQITVKFLSNVVHPETLALGFVGRVTSAKIATSNRTSCTKSARVAAVGALRVEKHGFSSKCRHIWIENMGEINHLMMWPTMRQTSCRSLLTCRE